MEPLLTHRYIPSSVLSTVSILIGILQVSLFSGHTSIPCRLSKAEKHQQTGMEILIWDFTWGTRVAAWGPCGLFKAPSAPVSLMWEILGYVLELLQHWGISFSLVKNVPFSLCHEMFK